jgi:hypothetical protein
MRISRSIPSSLFFLLVTSLLYSQVNAQPRGAQAAKSYDDIPLAFESNVGQAPGGVDFLSHSVGASVELAGARAIFTLSQQNAASPHTITFQWMAAHGPAKAEGENELSGRTNYLVGDHRNWLRGIKNYGRVRYASIYPDIDLVYYGNQRKLEYDLELAPHADASQIKLAVQGADQLIPQSDGSLIIRTEAGDLAWEKPVAYQMKDGKRIEVSVAYRLGTEKDTETLAFDIGPYDHKRALTIDPTLQYAAVIGPTEFGQYTAADSSSSAYILSYTISPEYPTTSGSYMPTGQFSWQPPSLYTGPNHPLLAITKFSPDGSTLIYSTYLGGSQFVCGDGNASPPTGNRAAGITVDAAGNAIVAGWTDDTNFPVTANAIQSTDKNCSVAMDVIVSKLSADGSSLLYSTYLGSSGNDIAGGVAVDQSDNIYVGGLAQNSDFEVTKNLSSCTGTCDDVFVTKINADGTLGYSLLFGGKDAGMNMPSLRAIAVDQSGNAYVAGYTYVPLPVVNALEPTMHSGSGNEGFVGEVNADGTGFNFLTYLGGSTASDATGIAVDGSGNVYATGWTLDNDFPIANAYQSQNKAFPSFSGFLTKYSPGGRSYVYSTYLGGSKNSQLVGVAVGPDQKAFLAGTSVASDFPVTPDAFQSANSNRFLTTFTAFNPAGTSLFYSTYLGGTASNGASTQAESIAVTPDGQSAFVVGSNFNNVNVLDFPVTPGAYDNAHTGDPSNNTGHNEVSDTFVARFCMNCTSPANITITSPQDGAVVTNPVHFMVSAYDPDGVAALQIYAVPGKVAYQTTSSTINTNLNLAPGNYAVVVQEWSNSGTYLKKTVNITVQNAPPKVKIGSPIAGTTVSNPVHVVASAKVNGVGTIVHYRVYSGQGVAVYDVSGKTLNAYVHLPQGAVNLTVVAWDSSGAAGAASANITVNGGSGGAQVVITSPSNFATVSSPVTFTATATASCGAGIYAMQVYTNPGVLAYTTYSSSVNTAIDLSPGYYYGAVQAWDNCGGTFSTPVQFRVQ